MKVAVIQLPYSTDHKESNRLFDYELQMLDNCDDSFAASTPTVLEIEGMRFAFMACYDFYF